MRPFTARSFFSECGTGSGELKMASSLCHLKFLRYSGHRQRLPKKDLFVLCLYCGTAQLTLTQNRSFLSSLLSFTLSSSEEMLYKCVSRGPCAQIFKTHSFNYFIVYLQHRILYKIIKRVGFKIPSARHCSPSEI
jgi:hypothetical protein